MASRSQTLGLKAHRAPPAFSEPVSASQTAEKPRRMTPASSYYHSRSSRSEKFQTAEKPETLELKEEERYSPFSSQTGLLTRQQPVLRSTNTKSEAQLYPAEVHPLPDLAPLCAVEYHYPGGLKGPATLFSRRARLPASFNQAVSYFGDLYSEVLISAPRLGTPLSSQALHELSAKLALARRVHRPS